MHILYKYHNSLRDSILPPPVTNCSIVSYNSYSCLGLFKTLLKLFIYTFSRVFLFIWRRLFYSAFSHFFVGAKTGKNILLANKESGTLISLGGLRPRWPSAVSGFRFQVSGFKWPAAGVACGRFRFQVSSFRWPTAQVTSRTRLVLQKQLKSTKTDKSN